MTIHTREEDEGPHPYVEEDTDIHHYYGEWASYNDEKEKKEIRTYLELWKKYFLRKLPSTLSFVEEQWIDGPTDPYSLNLPTLGLKIKMKGILEDEEEE